MWKRRAFFLTASLGIRLAESWHDALAYLKSLFVEEGSRLKRQPDPKTAVSEDSQTKTAV